MMGRRFASQNAVLVTEGQDFYNPSNAELEAGKRFYVERQEGRSIGGCFLSKAFAEHA